MQLKIGKALVEPDPRSAQEALAEVKRELDVRKRCFVRWVDDGKMSEVDAIDRYERLYTAAVVVEQYIEAAREKVINDVALPTFAVGG